VGHDSDEHSFEFFFIYIDLHAGRMKVTGRIQVLLPFCFVSAVRSAVSQKKLWKGVRPFPNQRVTITRPVCSIDIQLHGFRLLDDGWLEQRCDGKFVPHHRPECSSLRWLEVQVELLYVFGKRASTLNDSLH
jgi:hypothetical protein